MFLRISTSCFGLGSVLVLWWLALRVWQLVKSSRLRRQWRGVCEDVRRRREFHERLQLEKFKRSDREGWRPNDKIARMSAADIVDTVQGGKLSASTVVENFSRRCLSIGYGVTNSVTEEFFDEALDAAAELDRGRRGSQSLVTVQGGEYTKRVLEGLPVSIKDCLHMKGALSTCGMACKAALGPHGEDGLIVQIIREAGAIPIVRSNVPQCMMLPESNNSLFGRSCNPWNQGRTPGGSSGGEGTLVASRCTPLGIGTDIGGSVRIPCHFNGICGLKPTPERMTRKGMAGLSKSGRQRGQQVIRASIGPMANSVGDIGLAMSALCSPAMWRGDPSLPQVPWDTELVQAGVKRPLKVGYFTSDHWFQPCKTVARAVRETVEGLRSAGHEVEPFDPPETGWEVARLYYGQLGAEGNLKGYVDALQGEAMLPEYDSLRAITNLPNFLRPAVAWVLESVMGDERRASMLRVTKNGGLSTRDYWRLVGEMFDFRLRWEEAFVSAGLDAVVYPPAALPALPHGTSKDLTPAFTYTFLANLLSWPAGVVPVTRVQPEEEEYKVELLPPNQRDATARKARRAMEGSAGLPVGVQVMTLPFKDELAVVVMGEVEKVVAFTDVPSSACL